MNRTQHLSISLFLTGCSLLGSISGCVIAPENQPEAIVVSTVQSAPAPVPARPKRIPLGSNRRVPTVRERRSDGLFQILVIRLHSSDPAERTCAATDMGTLLRPPSELIPPLVQALKHDQSKWVRRAAAKSLGKIGSRAAIQPLTEALNDKDQWVVHSAANALRSLRVSA